MGYRNEDPTSEGIETMISWATSAPSFSIGMKTRLQRGLKHLLVVSTRGRARYRNEDPTSEGIETKKR